MAMSNDADRMFAEEMIKHHEGAVEMSEKFLKEGSDPKLLFFAKGVIKAQNPEIKFLQGWLKKNKSQKKM